MDQNDYASLAFWSQLHMSCVSGTKELPQNVGGRDYIQSSSVSGA